jgi:hypothetical protein
VRPEGAGDLCSPGEITLEEWAAMPEGTSKRLTDEDFGFIDMGTDKDLFFHKSNLQGFRSNP